jgi:Formate hydrogenlyase subunit 6/NADH:ubiquinone oxidoreductase 23 kD subunit (chain I)
MGLPSATATASRRATLNALRLDAHDLPAVAEDLCTACGDCVTACPKDLFSLQPADDHLWVRCRNEDAGDALLDVCSVACTACGRCAMDAPAGTLTMAGGLPLIDSTALHRASDAAARAAIERCPTGAIVWITDDGTALAGRAARPVVRRSVRPAAAS